MICLIVLYKIFKDLPLYYFIKMSQLENQFNVAANDVKNFKTKPTDDELLCLYKYYKQATIGKCNTTKPWMINVVESTKWTAWNSLGNMSKEEAMKSYIKLVNELRLKCN